MTSRDTRPLTLDEHIALGGRLKAMHDDLTALVARLDAALASSGRDAKLRRQAKRAQTSVLELRVQLEDNLRRTGLFDAAGAGDDRDDADGDGRDDRETDTTDLHRIYFGRSPRHS